MRRFDTECKQFSIVFEGKEDGLGYVYIVRNSDDQLMFGLVLEEPPSDDEIEEIIKGCMEIVEISESTDRHLH